MSSLNVVVEEISKETIKPSSPTPDHLKTHHFSIFDQVMPPHYTPTILFYEAPTSDSDDISRRLKKSLSEALTRFYPVAGRIKGNTNMFLECNDEGIDYIEARAVEGSSISSFMKRDALLHLLPANINLFTRGLMDDDPHLIVKVTFFDCGGIAICICLSHKIIDAQVVTNFINCWASIARGGGATDKDDKNNKDNDANCNPSFEMSNLYPPRENIPAFPRRPRSAVDHGGIYPSTPPPKVSSRRLIFDAPKIAALQAKYSDPSNGNYPTRVEAVSTLVWKTAMAASSTKSPCLAAHALNMRKRMDPPLPRQAFGNFIMLAPTPPVMKKPECMKSRDIELWRTMKEAMSIINGEYVKAIQQGDEGRMKQQYEIITGNMVMDGHENVEIYKFTSWCRFPLYDSDFGWGKPKWVTACAYKPFRNVFFLMDSNSSGDDIEVYFGLWEEEMARFELDQELLEFVDIMD